MLHLSSGFKWTTLGKVVSCIEKPLLRVNASFGATAHCSKFVPLLVKHHAMKVSREWHYMEKNGRLHFPDALKPTKGLPVANE